MLLDGAHTLVYLSALPIEQSTTKERGVDWLGEFVPVQDVYAMPEDPGPARGPSTIDVHPDIALGSYRCVVGTLGARFAGLAGHVAVSPRAPLKHKLPDQPVDPDVEIKTMAFIRDETFELATEDLDPDRLCLAPRYAKQLRGGTAR